MSRKKAPKFQADPPVASDLNEVNALIVVAKLEYKLKEQGKHLVKLDQWYASSKTCHCCGHKMEEMPLSVRKWDCPSCGTTDINRDLNAALNIRDKGILELKAVGRSSLLMEAA
jgi:putative transposase